jgi:sugar lactone lactonase YvrE
MLGTLMKPSIEPHVWSPPPRRKTAGLRKPLPPLKRLALPSPGEDVAIDREGRLLAGLADGRVVRVNPTTFAIEVLVDTGGRPGGIEVDADGSLIVCDMRCGLLRVYPEERRYELLVDVRTSDVRLCNNAAIASDGGIFFSDSSRKFDVEHWQGDLLANSASGRLFYRAPDGRLEVLLDGLQFANGVALAQDESFVAVAETGGYRIKRVWLKGERRGQSEIWIDDLPGFPDNLARDARGLIWAAIASPRSASLDFLHRSAPLLRKLVWQLPAALQPKPRRDMCVLAFDESGRVVHELAGTSPSFHMITGMRVDGDKLYLASLAESALAVCRLR